MSAPPSLPATPPPPPRPAAPLRLLVGLGNPGVEYAFTPHNFGFLLVDELARRCGARVSRLERQALVGHLRLGGLPVLAAKPVTFMNLSGVAVRELLRKHEIAPAEMLVVSDDLDLPLGALRLRERGSAGTHNGMRSIVGALGGGEFPRLRLGIAPEHRLGDAARFVLAPWRKPELEIVARVLERAGDAVEMMAREGLPKAMSLFNARPPRSAEGN